MEKRNTNIDIVRAMSIILIIFYHCYVIVGANIKNNFWISPIMNLGGEIGVTIFFLLSGYGIYNSLSGMNEKNGKIDFRVFLKKRLKRIYPQYALCLLFLLIFTSSAIYFSSEGLFHIATHFILIHNFFYNTHGSINGALWTMGVIFQFYIVAPIMYKYIVKYKFSVVFFILINILFKYIIYSFLSYRMLQNMYFFIYGRQFFTAMDNFAIGMCVANMLRRKTYAEKNRNYIFLIVAILIILVFIYTTNTNNIYTNSIMGYVWHSILAIILGAILFIVSIVPTLKFRKLRIGLSFVSKYQYGIYLWHLIIINNLLQYSSIFKKLSEYSLALFTITICIISIFMGALITVMVESSVLINRKNLGVYNV